MSDTEPEPRAAELPRVLRLLWGHEEPARRGPKPGLSLTSIATGAVRVADAEGLSAVSMGRVAKELGFTTMSLYRYLDSKDDLYTVMLDHAYGPAPVLDVLALDSWRPVLGAWCRANREVLVRHPWMHQVPVLAPPLGPNQLSWMECGVGALSGTPLTAQQKLSCLLLADVYVRGLTRLAATMNADYVEAPADADRRYAARVAQLVDAQRFPHLVAALLSGGLVDDDSDFGTDEFEFGLTTVLDGIEALVSRSVAKSGASS